MSKVKHCSKGRLFWYQTFDSLGILISDDLSLILRKLELHQENWHGREARFSEPVQVEGYYIEWLQNNSQKENRLILCVYMHWKSMKRWSALIHNDQETSSKKWTDKKRK